MHPIGGTHNTDISSTCEECVCVCWLLPLGRASYLALVPGSGISTAACDSSKAVAESLKACLFVHISDI
jgi:hypothetical protein